MRAAVIVIALLLSGCGGGDATGSSGGPINSIPTPTPTPAPTPTPTASPTPSPEGFNASLVDLRFTQQFDGLDSVLLYDRGGDGLVSSLGGYAPSAGYNPIYDVDTRTWYYVFVSTRLPGFGSPPAANPGFAPADRLASQSTNGFTVWRSTLNGSTFTFTLLDPATNNPQLALRYASAGLARGTTAPGASVVGSYDTRAFAFGIPSESRDIPTRSRATYTGIVIGEAAGENVSRIYRLSGSVTINVDYETETFSGNATLRGTSEPGEVVTFPTIEITQPRAGLDALYGYAGAGGAASFEGRLAGPAAEELYGSFRLQMADPANSSAQLTVIVALAAKR